MSYRAHTQTDSFGGSLTAEFMPRGSRFPDILWTARQGSNQVLIATSNPNDVQDLVNAIADNLGIRAQDSRQLAVGDRVRIGNSPALGDGGYVSPNYAGAEGTVQIPADSDGDVLVVKDGDAHGQYIHIFHLIRL